MGNYLAMLMGFGFIIIGAVLWGTYWKEFVSVLKGVIGFTLFFVGLLALVIGWSEHKASSEFEKATPPPPPAPETVQPAATSAEPKD